MLRLMLQEENRKLIPELQLWSSLINKQLEEIPNPSPGQGANFFHQKGIKQAAEDTD